MHEFSGTFRGGPATFRVTSVKGHVYNLVFAPEWWAHPFALSCASPLTVDATLSSTSTCAMRCTMLKAYRRAAASSEALAVLRLSLPQRRHNGLTCLPRAS